MIKVKVSVRTPLLASILLVVLAFSLASIAEAKGPFQRIVAFTGIGGSVPIEDSELIEFFSFSNFQNQIAWPAAPGEGVLITRYFEDQSTGEEIAFDHLWIYPRTEGRGPFVFYQGIINGSSEYDGKLYEGDLEAWMKLREILDRQAHAGSAPGLDPTISHLLVGLSGLIVGAVAGWTLINTANILPNVSENSKKG